MKSCPVCHKNNRDTSEFCEHCGSTLNDKIDDTLIINVVEQKPRYSDSEGINGLIIIIGILSLTGSIFINILSLPAAIIGLIIGITSKEKKYKKAVGITINLVAIAVSSLFLNGQNKLQGTWDCKYYNGTSEAENYIISMSLNKNNNFEWYKYEDNNNKISGKYNYNILTKLDNNYKYYYLNLVGEENSINNSTENNKYTMKYEVSINKKDGHAIIINENSYNMYSCYKRVE